MAEERVGEGLVWHDVREWGVEGKGWQDTEAYFDRLPARAKGVVRPPVWDLGRHTAGMSFEFETDSPQIAARWTLTSTRLSMVHMPATGVSGLDLYACDDQGDWRWLQVGKPETAPQVQVTLTAGLAPAKRRYRIYLPLYNGVREVAIGVARSASFQPIPPRPERPIVFYGTSITQGGCASRPGMAYPAILGRRLNVPIINLGFSGNGRMEPEVASLLAELDPCLYVVDCLPNMTADLVAENAERLVHILRRSHPETPILLMEDRTYANACFIEALRQRNESSRAALRQAYHNLQQSGVTGLFYLSGECLLGEDGEATVDGSHPTDLGFLRIADALTPTLKAILTGVG